MSQPQINGLWSHPDWVVAGASVVAGGCVSSEEESPEFVIRTITRMIAATARMIAMIVPSDEPRDCVT